MACGAMQNARLLLASNQQAANGVGNDYDLVGRYFMDHIEMPGANLLFAEPRTLQMYVLPPKVAGENRKARGELALSEDTQRVHRILNGTASIEPGHWGENIRSTFQKFTPDVLSGFRMSRENDEDQSSVNPLRGKKSRSLYRLKTRQEQAPNPDSRITLSDQLDPLGVPRLKVDWRLTDLDKYSIRRFYELLGQEMGRTGLGRIQLAEWLMEDNDTSWPSFLSGGWHHMGTARMHNDPRQGVVNSDCRVHGIDNLYIAGSAPFPTSGAPNPTLTLIALTLRLSDYLRRKIS
jgi:choline dehydrogenase-like flavoprotein